MLIVEPLGMRTLLEPKEVYQIRVVLYVRQLDILQMSSY